jgi:hypothetical protein
MLSENLVRLTELTDLTLERLDSRAFIRRQTRSLALVAFSLANPTAKRRSNTIRTASSRTSGENLLLLCFVMAPLSQKSEPPKIPERFKPTTRAG